MKHFVMLATALFAQAAFASDLELTPAAFRLRCAVEGELTPDLPVRVPLPAGIIEAAAPRFADLRVFDDQGRETPYVVYRQTETRRTPVSFTFEIVSFDGSEASEVIVVKQPDRAASFHVLELVISGRDFNKRVQVETGPDEETLRLVATDAIFDFTSRVNLRKTTVRLPETSDPVVRLTLTDQAPAQDAGREMKLRFEGLEFWTDRIKAGPFRIDRVIGHGGESQAARHDYDRIDIEDPRVTTDDAGNTVVHLGRRVPVAEITMRIDNAYYYRRVELLAADAARDDRYHPVGSGVIYKFPGMIDSRCTIRFDQPARHLRLRVRNDDNPPLRIRGVEIAWIRRNLYFVPEAGRTYHLFVGADGTKTPRYELQDLIPEDHARLRRFAAVSLSEPLANPGYVRQVDPGTRANLERALFVGLIIALVSGLSFWFFRLMKKLPGRADA